MTRYQLIKYTINDFDDEQAIHAKIYYQSYKQIPIDIKETINKHFKEKSADIYLLYKNNEDYINSKTTTLKFENYMIKKNKVFVKAIYTYDEVKSNNDLSEIISINSYLELQKPNYELCDYLYNYLNELYTLKDQSVDIQKLKKEYSVVSVLLYKFLCYKDFDFSVIPEKEVFLSTLDEYFSVNPNNNEFISKLSFVYIYHTDKNKVIDYFTKINKDLLKDEVKVQVGSYMFRVEEWELCKQYYEMYLINNQLLGIDLLNYANTCFKLKEYNKCIPGYRKFFENLITNSDSFQTANISEQLISAKLNYFYSLSNAKVYNELIILYPELIKHKLSKTQKDNVEKVFVNALIETEKTTEGKELIIKLLQQKENDLFLLKTLSNIYEKEHNYLEIIKTNQKIIKYFPSEEFPYIKCAKACIDQKKYNDAINFYKKGLIFFPNSRILLYNLSNIYIGTKKFDLSIPYLKKILETNPDDQLTLYTLGLIYNAKKDSEKSIFFFKKAANLGNEDAKRVLKDNKVKL